VSKILAVIVNYRSAALTLRSVRELAAARVNRPDIAVHVVENDSGDAAELQAGLSDAIREGWLTLTLAPKNGGFAYGNNLAIRAALASSDPPDFVFLMNPDAMVRPLALERLLAFMEKEPAVGIAGARLENADGTDWNWAFRFPNVLGELDRGLHLGIVSKLLAKYVVPMRMGDSPTKVDWLPGAAMLIRREVFEKVGLMDENYFLYYGETDFCLAAARAGFECWYYPDARVLHLAGQSTGVNNPDTDRKRLPDYWFESRRRFFVKNFGLPYAVTADAAFILGAIAYNLRMRLQGRVNREAPHLISDSLRHFSLLP
jgi:GT2 family glycosyltransferase